MGANKVYLERLQKFINRSLRICLLRPRDAKVYDLHLDDKLLPLSMHQYIALVKLIFSKAKEETFDVTTAKERVRTRGKIFKATYTFSKI